MPEQEKVRLTHPDVTEPIEVDPEAVPGWEDVGWKQDTRTTRKSKED